MFIRINKHQVTNNFFCKTLYIISRSFPRAGKVVGITRGKGRWGHKIKRLRTATLNFQLGLP
jgi:hypothetical protein